VLTATPPASDREALVRTAAWTTWPGWERFTLGACIAYHLAISAALILAPDHQIYNAGTAPLFDLASRYVWGGACLFAGATGLLLMRRRSLWAQMATWYVVGIVGFMWCGTFIAALVASQGSAIGATVFPFLYLWFGAAAVRIGLRKR
jgi:hypothetical protein